MIAVTGANGYIAGVLIRHLALGGSACLGISRSPSPGALPENVTWCTAPEGLPRADQLAGCSAVIHLAARVHAPAGEQPELFHIANCQLAAATARAAMEAGVPRFVFVSTVGVHGSWSPKPVDATTPLRPDTPYARAKWAAEQALTALCGGGAMALSIVRPPMVYGPGCPGNFGRLARLVRRQVPLPFASVQAPRSFVAVENLAGFLVRCAALDAPQGTCAITDGSDWVLPQLLQDMADAMHARCRLFPCAPSFLRTAARVVGRAREADSLTRPMRIATQGVWERYQWAPATPPSEALRRAASWYAR